MTEEVELTVWLSAPPDAVWDFIADPEKRAGAISVVEDWEISDDGRRARWEVRLPIPLIDRTITVDTKDRERDPPHFVSFTGRSTAMNVRGKHELEPVTKDPNLDGNDGTRLTNTFLVDGKLPGVERFFERQLETELKNLEAAIENDLGVETAVESRE